MKIFGVSTGKNYEGYGIDCGIVIAESKEEVRRIVRGDNKVTMDDLFTKMKFKAETFNNTREFQTAIIILGKYSGFNECHEFITILPVDTEKELFDKMAALLENLYKM